jgi:hypothetical protein
MSDEIVIKQIPIFKSGVKMAFVIFAVAVILVSCTSLSYIMVGEFNLFMNLQLPIFLSILFSIMALWTINKFPKILVYQDGIFFEKIMTQRVAWEDITNLEIKKFFFVQSLIISINNKIIRIELSHIERDQLEQIENFSPEIIFLKILSC